MKLSEYPWRTTPFKHQREGIVHLVKNKGKGLLYCEPGTGKTKIAIDFCGFAHLAEKIPGGRVFVAAPLSALGTWERQIKEHLPKEVPVDVIRLEGKTDKKIEQLKRMESRTGRSAILGGRSRLVFVLCNYGVFHNKKLAAQLVRAHFDCVVVDECHRASNPTTAQSKVLARIARDARYRLGLTGTPLRNAPLDLYGQARLIDENIYPMRWGEFKQRYAVVGGPANPYIIKGYQNLDDLYGRIEPYSFIRRKEQCLDLPSQTFETVSVPLSDATRAVYIQMAEQMVAEIEQTEIRMQRILSGDEDLSPDDSHQRSDTTTQVKGVRCEQSDGATASTGARTRAGRLTPAQRAVRAQMVARATIARLVRLRQIAAGLAVIETPEGKKTIYISDEKAQAAVELATGFHANDRQVVMFATFRAELDRLEKMLKAKKLRVGVLHGGITGPQRDKVIDRFQKGELDVFLAQIEAGSESIDLFAAYDCIYANITWKYVVMSQSEDRIHRIGQTHPCTYYYVIAENTIEEDILESLAAKEDFADTFMRTPSHLAGRLRTTIEKLREKS